MSSRRSHPAVTILASVFFVSGFSALLYQVVWQRIIGLFTGTDLYSITIVTGAFLAGLGIGSYLGSQYADRLNSRRAVQIFGYSNLGIGLFAFLSRFIYYDLLFNRWSFVAESPLVMFLIVFVSLLWPTTLMGLSLPFLARALVQNVDKAATRIGWLYALNTIGAGIGALVAGWVLIGNLGFDGAIYVGAILSTLVGLAALIVASRVPEKGPIDGAGRPPHITQLRDVPLRVWGWSGLVFVSGFTVISLELVWFRLLNFVMKSTAYSFGHLLGIFLIADALGTMYGTRLLRFIKHPRRAFLAIQGVIALYALLSTAAISAAASKPGSLLATYFDVSDGQIPAILFSDWGPETASYLYVLIVVYLLLPLLILGLPAFLIGLYYPIVQKAIQTDADVVGQRVGITSAANILGNTLGSVLTGVVLLGLLGTQGTLRFIGAIGMIMLIVLLIENRTALRERQTVLGGALAAFLVAALILTPGNTIFWAQMHGPAETTKIAGVAEDATGVAAIRRRAHSPNDEMWLNGLPQGNTAPFDPFHTWLGLLPILIHPAPRHVMTIGIGTGNTPYAIGVRPETEKIAAVEIISADVNLLKSYARQGDHVALLSLFNDDRYEIIIGDGRREIMRTRQPLDLVVVDALVPHSSHSGTLYSYEFYQTVRSRLFEDGLLVQWNPTRRVELTMASVFPYVMKFPAELTINRTGTTLRFQTSVLIASSKPIPFDREAVLRQLDDPALAAYFAAADINVLDYQSWVKESPQASWDPETPRPAEPLNTDLFPRDEYYLNNPYP